MRAMVAKINVTKNIGYGRKDEWLEVTQYTPLVFEAGI